jgi:hypothetical protein
MKRVIVALLTSAMIYTSCEDENSNDPSLPADDRDQYTGTWTCADSSQQFGTSTYSVTISKTGSADSIRISNFYQLGSNNFAIGLVSANSLTIPSQTVTSINITGFGTKNNNKITVNYSADSDNVESIWTKQ